MKEALSLLLFLSGISLIITGFAFYWTEKSFSAGKFAVASGIWLMLCWANSMEEKPQPKLTRQRMPSE